MFSVATALNWHRSYPKPSRPSRSVCSLLGQLCFIPVPKQEISHPYINIPNYKSPLGDRTQNPCFISKLFVRGKSALVLSPSHVSYTDLLQLYDLPSLSVPPSLSSCPTTQKQPKHIDTTRPAGSGSTILSALSRQPSQTQNHPWNHLPPPNYIAPPTTSPLPRIPSSPYPSPLKILNMGWQCHRCKGRRYKTHVEQCIVCGHFRCRLCRFQRWHRGEGEQVRLAISLSGYNGNCEDRHNDFGTAVLGEQSLTGSCLLLISTAGRSNSRLEETSKSRRTVRNEDF